MITINKVKSAKSTTNAHSHNNWSFLPNAFSALAGVGIGIAIGSYLGWL